MKGLADVKVTLYDIFGYLMPGLVALGGLGILGWAIFWPTHPIHAFVKGAGWFALILVGYIVGHLVQTAANALTDWLPRLPKLERPEQRLFDDLPPRLREWITDNTHVGSTDAVRNYVICDTAIAQTGSTGDREIYQYREGFYRGLLVAFPVLAVGLVVRASRSGAAVKSAKHAVYSVSTGMLVALTIVTAIATLFSWGRYRRFQKYKINNAYYGYLIILNKLGKLPPPIASGG